MKTIEIFYWHSFGKYEDTSKYEHKDVFDYSKKKRNSIIDYFIDKGYSVMLRPIEDNLLIAVTKGNFNQR